MSSSIVVRSQGPAREYFRTIAGALGRACMDAERMGCGPIDPQGFVDVIEEGRAFRLVGDASIVEFRAEPLGD